MMIDRGRWNGTSSSHFATESLVDGAMYRLKNTNGFVVSPSSPPPASSICLSGIGSIEHHVSKMDTLAGIAIKYGVEVADIKRMNSLVTDLQMFAHKKLQIPLPGRHPPSLDMSNGSSCNGDMLAPFQLLKSKPPQKSVSSAMSSLQGYYGLTPPKKGPAGEGTEMTVYRTSKVLSREFGGLPPVSPASEPPPSRHRKSRSLVNGILSENRELAEDLLVAVGESNGDSERSYSEKSVRRRQKTDVDAPCRTPDSLLRVDSGGFLSGRAGKNPTPKPKFGSKVDLDSTHMNTTPIEDFLSSGFFSVKRSSSTSSLQDSDGSSLWPTAKWTLKTDTTARSLFDGMPKPLATRKNKAALD